MRLGSWSCSARVLAVMALGALVGVGCGQKNSPSSAARGTTAPGSTIASCGISLCDSTSSTSTSPTSTGTTTTPWVAATANLAGLPSECGNMSLVSASSDQDM